MRVRAGVALTLFLSLAASQAGLLVLSPVLADVASDFDVSTAAAGQLRTVSGITAGLVALGTGLVSTRIGLRDLLAAGLSVLCLGSIVSAVAPHLGVLIAAQILIGIGVGVAYTAGVAAAAEWSSPNERSRTLSLALLGPPLAWVVGMPMSGLVGGVSWRLAWIVVPLAISLVALVVVALRCPTAPASARADVRAVVGEPGVTRWSLGELCAYSAWTGTLVFAGALFVESYDLSVLATGAILGFAALIYVPGNLIVRRWVDAHARALLVGLALAAAATVAVLGAWRVSAWESLILLSILSFVAGGRTLAGSARGLDLAPELRLAVTGVRTAALQFGYFVGGLVGGLALAGGGFAALGFAFAGLFVCATIPHLLPGAASLR
jgi:DHA1 family inner membrane transport protein